MRVRREANFELLRILAMLMVISMHFLSHTGALPEAGWGRFPKEREIFGVLAESFCIVAVNVYVLISGYFLSEKSFSFRRLARLIGQILFYTLLIPPVLAGAGVISWTEAGNIYHLWDCLFPVESGHYWFVTAYVVMLLFTPLLNAAVRMLQRRQLKACIFCLLAFFCLGKSLSIFLFASDRYGYDFGWFLCLYLIAAYLRKYGSAFFVTKKRGAAVYAASCALTALLALVSLSVCARTGLLEYYSTVPFHYNFILSLAGALGLFACMARLRIRSEKLSRLICAVSPAMFGVYLLHEHADISGRWAMWIIGDVSGHLGGYLIQMAESVLLVFLAGVCVDLARARLFALAERLLAKTGFGRACGRLFAQLDEMMEGAEWEKRQG